MINVFSLGEIQIGWTDGHSAGTNAGNSALSSFCNVLAASLVAVNLIAKLNLSSSLAGGSAIVIGLFGLSRALFGKKGPQVQPARPLPGQDVA